ncbi:MFS transporter [Vreelandella boliviensis]|uniref:MFS transporter n=1 Tax=Vreelandella boliviensis TaxID=223527 RepID=UPI001B8AF0B1|nr:MFS transporter [Halomonas boliviensis]MBS3669973.1 MFS transporter [Halomonas boliviensis]
MKRAVVLFFIALGLFGVFTIEFSVIGVMPQIVTRFDVTLTQAGWLVSGFALTVALSGPIMVLWLKRYDRKRVLISGMLILALCSVLSAYASNFWALMALRIPSALLLPVFFSLAFAAAVDMYPTDRSAFAISMALMGESVGLVMGVPLISLIASQLSYEMAFFFCSAVCAVAAFGLLMLPDERNSRASENATSDFLTIFRKPTLWLALSTTGAILAAMFALYSYTVEYLSAQGLTESTVSFLLVIFGIGGLIGNYLAGRALDRQLVTTVLTYPALLACIYLALYLFAQNSLVVMLLLSLFWGAAHTAGLVVSQLWVAASGKEAPEFATSLFVSAANAGVMLGTTMGGAMITTFGMSGTIFTGWFFAALVPLLVLASLWWGRQEQHQTSNL